LSSSLKGDSAAAVNQANTRVSSFLVRAELRATDPRFLRLLSEALARIPARVTPVRTLLAIRLANRARSKTLAGLTTYSDRGGHRLRQVQPREGARQTIAFYSDKLERLSDAAASAVIAHELAHAWLNEHVSPEESKKREREADDLAAKWGFGSELRALDDEAESL